MANVNGYPKHSLQADEWTLSAVFALDAANNGTLVEGDDSMTLTHAGPGIYTVGWKNKWIACRAAHATFSAHTAVDLVAQPVYDGASMVNKTVAVRLHAAGVATDPPAAGTNVTHLSVSLVMRNNVVKGS